MSLLHYSMDGEYELSLSAWGEGILDDSTLFHSMRSNYVFSAFRQQHGRDPRDISLVVEDSSACGYCFTGISTDFLEKLETLKELVLPDPVTHLDMTPALEHILKSNDTLIRGSFGSFAQRFAAENGLHFRPADYVFTRYMYEPVQEGTTMTLVFRRDGRVQVREDISSPGSSAGSTLGGTFWYDLPTDFFRTQTAEEIAEHFRAVIYDKTIADGKLADFLQKAKNQGYFTGAN